MRCQVDGAWQLQPASVWAKWQFQGLENDDGWWWLKLVASGDMLLCLLIWLWKRQPKHWYQWMNWFWWICSRYTVQPVRPVIVTCMYWRRFHPHRIKIEWHRYTQILCSCGLTWSGREVGIAAQTGECEPRRGQWGSCQHQHQDQLQHPADRVCKSERMHWEKEGKADYKYIKAMSKTCQGQKTLKTTEVSTDSCLRNKKHPS